MKTRIWVHLFRTMPSVCCAVSSAVLLSAIIVSASSMPIEDEEVLDFLRGYEGLPQVPRALYSMDYNQCKAFLRNRFGDTGRQKTLNRPFWVLLFT